MTGAIPIKSENCSPVEYAQHWPGRIAMTDTNRMRSLAARINESSWKTEIEKECAAFLLESADELTTLRARVAELEAQPRLTLTKRERLPLVLIDEENERECVWAPRPNCVAQHHRSCGEDVMPETNKGEKSWRSVVVYPNYCPNCGGKVRRVEP
jgi:hypothetical protein